MFSVHCLTNLYRHVICGSEGMSCTYTRINCARIKATFELKHCKLSTESHFHSARTVSIGKPCQYLCLFYLFSISISFCINAAVFLRGSCDKGLSFNFWISIQMVVLTSMWKVFGAALLHPSSCKLAETVTQLLHLPHLVLQEWIFSIFSILRTMFCKMYSCHWPTAEDTVCLKGLCTLTLPLLIPSSTHLKGSHQALFPALQCTIALLQPCFWHITHPCTKGWWGTACIQRKTNTLDQDKCKVSPH